MQIREITNAHEWNSFVASLKANTFLQSWEWGQLQVATGEGVRYLGLFDDAKQVGAALLITVRARRGHFYLIPHGPLLTQNHDLRAALEALRTFVRLHAHADHAVALRIAPLHVDEPSTRDAFSALGFRPAPLHIHAELTWVLDISPSEEAILQGMRKTTRHSIRRAEKEGVTAEIVRDSQALERFWPLYAETKDRHGFVPFSKDFLQKQVEIFSKEDKVYFVFTRYNGEDVASAIFMHFGDTVFYHHGASRKLPAKVPAAQLLQWASIQEAKRRGALRYNFWGIAPDDQPHHPFAGITTFKKGFGGYALNYLHAQDLSLSPWYWKLWLIDSWRRYKRGF